MKPKASLFIIIGLLCIGILVFAVLKAAPASAPAKPAVTQQAIKNKLSGNGNSSSKQNQPAPKSPKTSGEGSSAANTQPTPTAKTGELSNTGPGQTFAIFSVAATIGYAARLAALRLAYKRTT